jgi:MoxR-like ATPase
MMRLSLGYPDRESELSILEDNPAGRALAELEPVLGEAEFLASREVAAAVFCHQNLKEAVADIVRDTRVHRGFFLGASPRAALHFLDAARALALVRGREYVIDEDVLVLAAPVLAHRVKFRDPKAQGDKTMRQECLREICLARLNRIKD